MDTGAALGGTGLFISLLGIIYSAINHKHIKARCCGKDLDISIDIDSTDPEKAAGSKSAKVEPEREDIESDSDDELEAEAEAKSKSKAKSKKHMLRESHDKTDFVLKTPFKLEN
jgi:hypothetical protein